MRGAARMASVEVEEIRIGCLAGVWWVKKGGGRSGDLAVFGPNGREKFYTDFVVKIIFSRVVFRLLWCGIWRFGSYDVWLGGGDFWIGSQRVVRAGFG